MRGWLLGWLLLAGLIRGSAAASLEPAFPDTAFHGVAVGQPLSVSAAERMGFEVAESLSAESGDSKRDVLRLERPDGQRVYFIELSVRDRLVRAQGWIAEAPADSAQSLAAACLTVIARAHGLPDDLIVEEDVHALAWIDRSKGLRLELLLQPVEGTGTWEISQVLRRFLGPTSVR